MEAGDGPPLVVVPATISELDNWVDLIQFMAQWFRVYFFELPGHGLSTPFEQKFTTSLVAQTVEHLVDQIGAPRFSLMGFSFGGILAMRTYHLLHQRIDRMILNAPCLTKQAIQLSPQQKLIVRQINGLIRQRAVQVQLCNAFHHDYTRTLLARLFERVGNLENRPLLEKKFATLQPSTIEVLAEEIHEILEIQFPNPAIRYETPCFLTMSVNDPVLDFQTTLAELGNKFSQVYVTRLSFPFHQPPKPFTFAELNRDFGESAQKFLVDLRN
jgi:pimeloyl-ACP methyl ester carboxylesterase